MIPVIHNWMQGATLIEWYAFGVASWFCGVVHGIMIKAICDRL